MPPTVTDNPLMTFIDSRLIGRYFDEITADMEDALGVASRNLSNAALKQCSTSAVSQYKKDKGYLDKSSRTFYDEYSLVREGKSKDLKKLQNAYEIAVRDLEVLELSNQMFTAVVDTALGVKLVAFFGPLAVMVSTGALFVKLKRDLDALKKDLERAQRDTNAKMAKATLGAGVAALGLMTGPVGIGTTVGIALATTAAGYVIDTVLGNGGSVEPLSTAKDASTTALDCYDQLDRVNTKAIPPLLTVASMTLDGADAGMSYMKQKKIQERIKKLVKEYGAAKSALKKNLKGLAQLQKAATKAYDDALKQANGYKSVTATRMRVAKDLGKYKAAN